MLNFISTVELWGITDPSYKRLAALDIDGGVNLVNTNKLIFATSGTNTAEISYILCNRNTALSVNIRTAIINGNIGTLSNEDYLLYDHLLLEKETQAHGNILNIGITNTFMFRSDTSSVNILVYGRIQ